jgi:hypothetical protein
MPAALFCFVFAVDEVSPNGMTADSLRAIPTAVSMVYWRTISLDHLKGYLTLPGVDEVTSHGHVYPIFPWATSLFAVPWVVADAALHKLGFGAGPLALVRTGDDWDLQVISMAAVVAATSVVIFHLAVRVLSMAPMRRRRRWALGVALVFAFATPAWSTASRSMWEHGPSMLCLSVALLYALRAQAGQRGWTGMGVALGLAYTIRPTDALVVMALGLWVLIWYRKHLWKVVVGAAVPLTVFVAVNLATYHQVLPPYFSQGGQFSVSWTFLDALAANLVSPARGLLIFVPLVVLSVVGVVVQYRRGAMTPFWWAVAAVLPAHLIVISAFANWWAGDAFGPRFFTDLLPLFVLLALPAVDHLAEHRFERQALVVGLVCAALVWSLGVEVQGATLRSSWCWNAEPVNVDLHPNNVWNWADPQFARGIRAIVFGPDRGTELLRDGVQAVGCPVEPVRP